MEVPYSCNGEGWLYGGWCWSYHWSRGHDEPLCMPKCGALELGNLDESR